MLKGRNVLWQTDNYAASIIIKAGSNKNHLQLLPENIFKTSISKNIRLNITWIPREQNKVADSLCKIIDYDDWTTTTQFFKLLSSIWGPFTIDRFAVNLNWKLPRFNSKYWCPGSENVNALAFSWENENNFLVSPVYLLSKVIKHIVASRANGVLVAPYWHSSNFWPLLKESKVICKGLSLIQQSNTLSRTRK